MTGSCSSNSASIRFLLLASHCEPLRMEVPDGIVEVTFWKAGVGLRTPVLVSLLEAPVTNLLEKMAWKTFGSIPSQGSHVLAVTLGRPATRKTAW